MAGSGNEWGECAKCSGITQPQHSLQSDAHKYEQTKRQRTNARSARTLDGKEGQIEKKLSKYLSLCIVISA